MDGLSQNEITAIMAASEPAGSYLEGIGKTDLAQMNESEWMTLLECIIVTALNTLADLSVKDIPFPDVKPGPFPAIGQQAA
jgi:hypothetical protein